MANPRRTFIAKHPRCSEYGLIFSIFWAIFALTNSGFDTSEGSGHYYIAEHFIKTSQLGVPPGQNFIDTDYVAPSGWRYGAHEIGNTLFMLPTALFNVLLANLLAGRLSSDLIDRLQQFIISFQPSVYSALTLMGFYGILKTGFKQRPGYSLLATAGLAFTSFFWAYTRNLYDGVLCTTLLVFSFWALLIYKRQRNTRWLIAIYVCLGFATITRLSMIFPTFATSFYIAWLQRRSPLQILRAAGIAALVMLPFALWQSWYNWLRTGIFYKSPVQMDAYAHNNGLDGNIWEGIAGLLVSPGKSLLIYVPLLVVSLLLVRKFYRDWPQEGLYWFALIVPWFLLHAKLRNWYGAWGWGPRHFVTVVPLLLLPLAVNLPYVFQVTRLRILTLVLSLWGFILGVAVMISNWHFRMVLARQEDRLDDAIFVWGWRHSQAIDMLQGAVGNLVRIATQSPPIVIASEYSEANEYVSSTLNVWPNALIAVGIPWYAALLATLPLWLLLIWSARTWYRCVYRPSLSHQESALLG